MFTRFLGGAILSLLLFVPSFATVYYVSTEGDNGNNGLSPDSAWRNVSYATQQVGNDPGDPDTVFVYPGLYDSGAGETFPIDVRSYTSLIGLDSIAVLSGDSYDWPVVSVSEEREILIETLEIRNGGGGIQAENCTTLVLYRNHIHDNKRYKPRLSLYGGGMRIAECKSVSILDVVAESNEVLLEDATIDAGGGGIAAAGSDSILIDGCTISGNIVSTKGDAMGGGLYMSGVDSLYVIGNVIEDNLAKSIGRPWPEAYGGGVYLNACGETSISGNVVSGNEAEAFAQEECGGAGGGVYLSACRTTVAFSSNLISHNEMDVSCRTGHGDGGGVYVGNCPIIFTDNIINDNGADYGGGVFAPNSKTCSFFRNQIHANHAYDGGGIGAVTASPESLVVGGSPGWGNDIYGNTAGAGDELRRYSPIYGMASANFNYFDGEPDESKVYPAHGWDTRFWRLNPIGENEPPHIIDYFPAVAETTLNIGDSLLFWVDVLDYDGDTTSSWWLLNGTQVADGDSFLFIADSQYAGYDTIQAAVTDYIDTTTQDWLVFVGQTGVTSEETERNLPRQFALRDNYPNPFNASTIIRYELPRDCHVCLEIFDLLGRKAATLVNGKEKAGYKLVIWNARTAATGFYFYRLSAGDFSDTKKMVLLK
ncbi:MAG: right-handed parallel beta-helix repeat-containing protein [Candidatus Zixiibacteriota bacterium]